MYRQKVTTEQINIDRLTLTGDQAHHLSKVLRIKAGSEIGCFDGDSRTRLYHVMEVTGKTLVLEAKQPVFIHTQASAKITLFTCISKGDRMTLMIEKATELGVTTIVPILSKRTIVRLSATEVEAKRLRWQRVADDAARQCGAVFIPQIALPVVLKETDSLMANCTTTFVAALIPTAKPFYDALADVADTPAPHFGWWTGPEGDFTADEMTFILEAGAIPVSLGPLILRAETAAIYGVAVLGCYANRSKESNVT